MNFEQPEFYLGYNIAFLYNFCATGWFGIPAGARDFSLLQYVQTGSWAHSPSLLPNGYQGLFLQAVKWPGSEADH
jgi:hypothetical protein